MFPFSIVKPRKKSAWKIVTEVEIIYKACLSITCIAYKIHNQKFYFLFMKHFFILDQQDSTWGSHSLCWPNSLNIMSLNKTVVVVWDSQGILMTKNCLSWMFAFVQGSYFPCFEAWGCMRTYIFVWHSSFSAMSFFSFPFKTLSLIAQSQSELQGRGKCTFLSLRICFCWRRKWCWKEQKWNIQGCIENVFKKKKTPDFSLFIIGL